MPSVARSRELTTSAKRVWNFAAAPRNLAKWWPKTDSIREIKGPAGMGQRWSQVFVTKKGRKIAAYQRCTTSDPPSRWAFEQEIGGTPFERVLKSARVELTVEPTRSGSRARLRIERRMRGLSILGYPFVRHASAKTADDALELLRSQLSEPESG